MQGEELKAARKLIGLSQSELATELGLTPQFIGMMERGTKPIERRTEMAVRLRSDRYVISSTLDGRWAVARRTIRDAGNMRMHGSTMLYGVFGRRDQAYRWALALKSSLCPRETRDLARRRKNAPD